MLDVETLLSDCLITLANHLQVLLLNERKAQPCQPTQS
jgi:hypothetical protein